jgi:Ca2+-binding RTX toxin-like protein
MANIQGTAGPDDLEGTGGDDVLSGLGGDDILRGRRGNDTIDGGDGIDSISFRGEGVTTGIKIDFNTGVASDGFGTNDTFTNVEGVIGTDFDDVMIGSNLPEIFRGRGGNDTINAGGGNDRIGVSGGNDTIDGGAGTDTINFDATRSQVALVKDASGKPVSSTSPQGRDTFSNIERVEFADGILAFDVGVGETAGSVYRVYQAAFDRIPDAGGLAYWINSVDRGTSLIDVAAGFVASAEFSAVYGQNTTNPSYIAQLYRNVLGREGETAGLAYWEQQLEQGGMSKAQVLANFAESNENIAGVAAAIADGIWIT